MRTTCALVLVLSLAVLAPALVAGGEEDAPRPEEISALEWVRDPVVLKHLSHPSADVRRRTARALGRIAAPGDEIATVVSENIAQALAKQLADEKDALVRRELLLALGQTGTRTAVHVLVAARDDGKATEDERVAASTALRFAATENDRGDLLRGLADEVPGIARDSALALGLIERNLRRQGVSTIDTDTRTALLRRIEPAHLQKARDPEVTYACVFAASALGDRRSDMRVALAFQLSTSEDDDTQAAAARGLAASAGPDLEPSVRDVLFQDAHDARVAVEVVHALARYKKDAKARAKLVAILGAHPSFHARAEAATALGDAPPDGEGESELAALASALDDTWETVRGAALASLARRKPVDTCERIAAFIKESVPARLNACQALAKVVDSDAAFGTKGSTVGAEAKLTLRKLVESVREDHRVRMAALEALGGAKDASAAFDLALSVATEEQDPGVLEVAVDILLKRGGDDSEAALAKAYERTKKKQEFAEAREGIVSGLADQEKLGAVARRTIETALEDPAASVSAAASKALAKLSGKPPAPDAKKERKPPAVLPRDWKGKRPVLAVETNRGSFEVELYPDEAPIHVANVVSLAEKKFYDGLTWHRVVPDFVVQGGCPRGDGSGDAGYQIPDELSARPYERGTLGMPKTAIKDTGGCQLFFTHGRTPHLDGRYTVFGRIRKGVATIDLLEAGDRIVKVKVLLE